MSQRHARTVSRFSFLCSFLLSPQATKYPLCPLFHKPKLQPKQKKKVQKIHPLLSIPTKKTEKLPHFSVRREQLNFILLFYSFKKTQIELTTKKPVILNSCQNAHFNRSTTKFDEPTTTPKKRGKKNSAPSSAIPTTNKSSEK